LLPLREAALEVALDRLLEGVVECSCELAAPLGHRKLAREGVMQARGRRAKLRLEELEVGHGLEPSEPA
jgi:hypothetical protein